MGYIDRLKNISNVPYKEPKETKESPNPNCLGFLGSLYGVLEKTHTVEVIPKEAETVHYSWLIHFADREPLTVAFSPAASHAEVLSFYPAALAAEPLAEDMSRIASCA